MIVGLAEALLAIIVALADALLEDGATLDEAAAVERGMGIVEEVGVEEEAGELERTTSWVVKAWVVEARVR